MIQAQKRWRIEVVFEYESSPDVNELFLILENMKIYLLVPKVAVNL